MCFALQPWMSRAWMEQVALAAGASYLDEVLCNWTDLPRSWRVPWSSHTWMPICI